MASILPIVLAIKVTDYLQKLLNRSSVLPRPEGYTEPEGPSEVASMRGRRQLIKDTTAFVAKTVRLKEDKKNVQARPGGLHKLHAMATNQEGRTPEEEIDSLDLQRLKVFFFRFQVERRSMNKQLSSNTARVRQLEDPGSQHIAVPHDTPVLRDERDKNAGKPGQLWRF
ncbi:hypothetical protein AK812_SmicGene10979 [Symbiodinium microadriaticum]|uniref:Uncharacterized protein n=1 Tax=Symbiodinium microadriaticum TaxID=2951 RepID=A0A1Q9EEC6_SYMMI|nr:hypothetical protein AK812_SmicGene10979 [Symbiodinium microadriaticum]